MLSSSHELCDASSGPQVPTTAGGMPQILGSIARDLLLPTP
jgi:hypothetical protein